MDRRTFLTNAASAAGAIALGCRPVGPDSPPITSSLAALPDPASSGIEHVVVFMMENRSRPTSRAVAIKILITPMPADAWNTTDRKSVV